MSNPYIYKPYCMGIQLNQGAVTWVDKADWPLATQFHWILATSRTDNYQAVMAHVHLKGIRTTLYLPRLLMSPVPEGMEVHHKDEDTLNNRRGNLEIVEPYVNQISRRLLRDAKGRFTKGKDRF